MKAAGQTVKKLFGWFGGPQPSKCHPNPATCAADSETLLRKVSLRRFPPVYGLSVDCHFAEIGTHVLCSHLCHFLFYQVKLFFVYKKTWPVLGVACLVDFV